MLSNLVNHVPAQRAKENSPAFQRWVYGREANESRQGRKKSSLPDRSFAPPGLNRISIRNPRLKPWAIFGRPSGTSRTGRRPLDVDADRCLSHIFKFTRRLHLIWIVFLLSLIALTVQAAPADYRSNLVHAILSEDLSEQTQFIQKLVGADDPLIAQALTAWRGGAVYIHDTNNTRTPFLLDAQPDNDGNAKGIRVLDGAFLKDANGKPLLFTASDLTPVDA